MAKLLTQATMASSNHRTKTAQGNVLMTEELALTKMNDSHRTPNKQDSKPAAKPEDQ
jgi:hypothetical protein